MLILADHENRPIYAEPEVTILVADFGSMQVLRDLDQLRNMFMDQKKHVRRIWGLQWTVLIVLLVALSGCGIVSGSPVSSTLDGSKSPSPTSSIVPVVPINLTNIYMYNTQDGVGIGSKGIYSTSDGAHHWTRMVPPGRAASHLTTAGHPYVTTAANRVSVGMTSTGTVWSVKQTPSNNRLSIHWTQNRGKTWNGGNLITQLFSQGPVVLVDNVYILGTQTAWISIQPEHGMNSEPGELWFTNNGGKTWTRIGSTVPSADTGTLPTGGRVSFSSLSHGWEVGSLASTLPNLVWTTQDGAQHWTQVSLPGYLPSRLDILAPPQFFANDGFLPVQYVPVSHKAVNFATVLYYSSNNGRTWTKTTPVSPAPISTLDIMNSTTVWLWTGSQFNSYAGYPVTGSLYVTTNSGDTWSQRPPTGTLSSLMEKGYTIKHLDFLNSQQGWATTFKLGTSQGGPLLETQNGGRSWKEINPNR